MARGVALLLMVAGHGMMLYLDPAAPPKAYAVLSLTLFFAQIAAPLFIWVFGATMAYVYLDQNGKAMETAQLWKRLWMRAFYLFLSREFLVLVVDSGEGRPARYMFDRLLYLQTGNWIEVLNCFLVLLLLAPWLLSCWSRMPLALRLVFPVALYGVGRWLAGLPVPHEWLSLKNILVGYSAGEVDGPRPDTFPVFQLSSFYFCGLLWGESLIHTMRSQSWRRLLFTGAGLGAVSLGLSLMLAALAPARYMAAIAYEQFKYPPNLPYIFYGFAGALAVGLVCVWLVEIRRVNHLLVRCVEMLGRHSLFTFNLQYVLLFTVGGVWLGLLKRQSLAWTVVFMLMVMVLCLAIVFGWDAIQRRLRERTR